MAATDVRPIGYGRLPRKEDARFIRGQGRYLDDIALHGMLHGAILRSPLAHARIVSIDTSAALALPRVHAVITGRDLEARGMAWMATMSADRQAVLATDKVRRAASPTMAGQPPGTSVSSMYAASSDPAT